MDDEPNGDATADLASTMRVGGRTGDAAILERALGRLDEVGRQVIVLRHRENHSFEEIARRLGIGMDEAQSLWFRAVEALSEVLEAPH